MIVYLNGRFIPETEASVSLFDRGFLYGDGLFEAVRVSGGEPFLWREHVERLFAGAAFLQIAPPVSPREMELALRHLLRLNKMTDGMARIALSRGQGTRGYSPAGADRPTFAVTLHPLRETAATYKLVISTLALPLNDPLARFKHTSRLRQVLARAEADERGVDEAILLNTAGCVAEGITTNLFWIENGTLCTPPLSAGILEGTTRAYVIRLAHKLEFPAREKNAKPADLFDAEGVFVTSSGIEIREATHLDGRRLRRSPLVKRLKRAFGREA